MASPENTEDNKNTSAKGVMFKERYEVMFHTPLPALNINNATAFEVKDITEESTNLFGLVCNNTTPPRVSILPYLRSISHSSILSLVDYGVIDYQSKKTENVILIYKKPTGPKLLDAPAEVLEDIKTNREKFKSLAISLLSAVEALIGHGVTHRSIRADNIFFKDEKFDTLVLGDCAACFPAYMQPLCYETAPSAITNKEARGNGSQKDDIYSAGISLLTLLKTEEFFKNFSDEKIKKIKFSKPSIEAYGDYVSYPKYLESLFKGLLDDNPETRWDYVNTYNHLQEKMTVNIKHISTNAKKPLIVGSKKLYNLKEISLMLSDNKQRALELINSDRFIDWLKESFDDKSYIKSIISIIKEDEEAKESSDILISKICIMLAPSMPIMYKGLSVFPQGLGKKAFAAIKSQSNEISIIKELFESSLYCLWFSQQQFLRAPSNSVEYKSYIKNKGFGYGLERIIYDIDDDLPCISPLFGTDYVNTVGKVIRSLNKNLKPQDFLYDKSIISYIRCKLGKKIQSSVDAINSSEKLSSTSAVLRLYTQIQNKFGPQKLSNLAIIIANFAMPIIKVYHNISLQRKVEEKLVKAARTGKLQSIVEALENKKLLDEDTTKYKEALQEKINLTAQKNTILAQLNSSNKHISRGAQKVAIFLSIIAMFISFVLSIINQFF